MVAEIAKVVTLCFSNDLFFASGLQSNAFGRVSRTDGGEFTHLFLKSKTPAPGHIRFVENRIIRVHRAKERIHAALIRRAYGKEAANVSDAVGGVHTFSIPGMETKEANYSALSSHENTVPVRPVIDDRTVAAFLVYPKSDTTEITWLKGTDKTNTCTETSPAVGEHPSLVVDCNALLNAKNMLDPTGTRLNWDVNISIEWLDRA